MTGTPLDLTPFGALLKGIGLLYWIALLACVGLALWWFKRWWLKLGVAIAVSVAFFAPTVRHAQEQQTQHDAAKARAEAARAHFEMRCKSAGEKVSQVVENVEGVLILKLRPSPTVGDDADPMWPGAAMVRESAGDEYIKSFLGFERQASEGVGRRGEITSFVADRPGYRFVDVIDSTDGQRYRYMAPLVSTGSSVRGQEIEQRLRREATTAPPPKYGVTFDDIVDPVDREHWVAGTSVQVVDLATNHVVAQLTLYAWDPGTGSRAGSRSPWFFARTCPTADSAFASFRTRHFVDRVLQPPKKGT